MDKLYSLENAQKFSWSSITGDLNPERVSHLETYLVGKKILDAGCGGGAYVEFLCQKGLEVTGIDKYEQFLQVARQKSQVGTYVEADLTNLPFPDKTFDCTYCFDVLEHIDDRVAIQELARVTGKRLIITVPKEDEVISKFGITFLHYQDKTHLRNYTESSLKDLISTINYSEVIIFPELAVSMKALVREMVDFKLESCASININYIMVKMKIRELLKLKNLSFKFLYKKTYDFLLNRLLEEASYKEIYTGLVAVIDL